MVPFSEVCEAHDKLYFVITDGEYDLRLGTPDYDWLKITHRQWLAKFEILDIPKTKLGETIPEELLEQLEDYGLEPSDLDNIKDSNEERLNY